LSAAAAAGRERLAQLAPASRAIAVQIAEQARRGRLQAGERVTAGADFGGVFGR
jgi:hypothetical protein